MHGAVLAERSVPAAGPSWRKPRGVARLLTTGDKAAYECGVGGPKLHTSLLVIFDVVQAAKELRLQVSASHS